MPYQPAMTPIDTDHLAKELKKNVKKEEEKKNVPGKLNIIKNIAVSEGVQYTQNGRTLENPAQDENHKMFEEIQRVGKIIGNTKLTKQQYTELSSRQERNRSVTSPLAVKASNTYFDQLNSVL